MKRLTILFSLVTLGVLLATAGAFMQSDSRSRFGESNDSQQRVPVSNELPRTHLNQNRLHKLIIKEKDTAIYNWLLGANAIRDEVDYRSYKLLIVDQEAIGGRAALQALTAAPRDDLDKIVLNGYLIDTSSPQPLSRGMPADLKQSSMSAALAGAGPPRRGLYIVQFMGPIKDEWLNRLQETRARIIAYVPNNAYIVGADERAAGELIKMKASYPFIQWLSDYEPGYKLTPGLQARHLRGDSELIRVTVQLIDNADGEAKANELKGSANQYLGERRVSKYRNMTLVISASQLAELAKSDEVFAVEEDHDLGLMDEAQGQIVAGNLSGNAPSGPGYLSWLASRGFDSSQFGSFAVNVVDNENSLRGHPDLPDSRVAFELNPSNQPFQLRGHGFLNAQIVGGFNDGAGSAHEDANGFNYGLGIAPWARVGVTAIFCFQSICPFNGGFNPTLWEAAAFTAGSRISSNSWGGNFGTYNTLAQEYDHIVRDAQGGTAGNQQLTVVFAAGNSGLGGPGSIGMPGTAKNVITVGASESVRQTGIDGCGVDNSGADSSNDIAFFSSLGPVNSAGGDGRVKPDIVAPGTHIQAGIPQSNYVGGSICDRFFPSGQTLYSWGSGTSHSAPAVAGGAALVYQYFLNQGMEAPSPAMIKAVLMNSASHLTGAGANDTLPSNSQGMGSLNLGRAFDEAPRLLVDQTRTFNASGETYQVIGSVSSASQPLRITLAWTDAPGSTTGAPWVNDLDLEVTINGEPYLGNVFSGAHSTTGGLPDSRNNVESIFLPAGLSRNFLVTVRATNIAGDGVPGNDDMTDQDFALVIYNANSEPVDSPIIEVSPLRLDFRATAGAPNPALQTVDINNIGIGTLEWTASNDASWLTVDPAGGTAPSLLTASVDIGGLLPGSYNGTIMISSMNAFQSPVSVPVTLTVLPVFVANPSTLTFLAAFGAGNPVNQTVDILQNDDRLRDWTATADVPWLIVSPTSGAAPSTLTISANIAGLPLGTYTGRISIKSPSPSAPQVQVPVTLIVDEISDGGFESPISRWMISGVAMRSAGTYPHSGAGYLLLGGANSSSGYAYQEITVPKRSSPNLSFWLNVTSSDAAPTPNDKLFIEVCNRSGKVIKRLATFSNLDQSAPGDYRLRGGYNLSAFAGKTVRIQFRTITDSSSVTSFRLDDVSAR